MSRFTLKSGTCVAVLLVLCVGPAFAADTSSPPSRQQLDWSVWKRIPVLDDGRIKPIDSLADEFVALVCGRTLFGKSNWKDPETNVTYDAAELLYAWIAAPSDWADKPMLRCEYRPLRKLLGEAGRDIPEAGKFVSLADVLDWQAWRDEHRLTFHSDDVSRRFDSFSRGKPANRVGTTAEDRELNAKLAELIRHMEVFMFAADRIAVLPGLDPRILTKQTDPDEQVPAWISLGSVLRVDEWRSESRPDFSIVALMSDNPRDLLEHEADYWQFPSDQSRQYPVENLPQLAQAQAVKGELQVQLRDVRDAFKATQAAYRRADANEFVSTMQIFERKLRRLGESLDAARSRMVPPKPGSLEFASGELNDLIWKRYVPLKLDDRQMRFSAYPAADATRVELIYNESQPFAKAWMVFLLAVVAVCGSMMVKASRTAYMAGLAVALAAILYAAWGFGLRIAIAGRPPVSNMYETVIWVSFVVAVLGFWFALLPFTWPGLGWSWRLTGLPVRLRRNESGGISGIEIDRLRAEERDKLFAGLKLPIQIVASVLRLGGFAVALWFLTASGTTFQVIDPVPPLFSESFRSTLSFGRLGTWCVGMAAVLTGSWYVPRIALTLLGGLILVVPEGVREQRARNEQVWGQILSRRFFVVPALTVATFGMMLAHFVGVRSPNILNPNIGSIAAVLRNNYWLTIHVLTIVSSYGAGALAWGIGNLAMVYYLFGKYRAEPGSSSVSGDLPSTGNRASDGPHGSIAYVDEDYGKPKDSLVSRMRRTGRALKPGTIGTTFKAGFQNLGTADVHLEGSRARPPKEVATLANYGYKVMQVAVLLLAAGTILGGLWADVSWGRFWDWDPKEVWALISLLVYLVVLHGRFAGWVGTFGTNVGSVLCFNAILMSWYGVNFVLPKIHGWLNGTGVPTEVGLHSYASGDSAGLQWIVIAVIVNLLFVAAAWARYAAETMDVASSTAHKQD